MATGPGAGSVQVREVRTWLRCAFFDHNQAQEIPGDSDFVELHPHNFQLYPLNLSVSGVSRILLLETGQVICMVLVAGEDEV